MTELEKCMAGEDYNCHDEIFLEFKRHARKLLQEYNALAYEQKEKKEFSFTQEGLDNALTWMNEQYEADRDNWERISKDQMRIFLETKKE